MGNKRQGYMANCKPQAVQYPEKHSTRSAGHKFDVNEQCIRECCIQKEREEHRLSVFQNRVLRRIFGSERDDIGREN
jgi:hypothetical protein